MRTSQAKIKNKSIKQLLQHFNSQPHWLKARRKNGADWLGGTVLWFWLFVFCDFVSFLFPKLCTANSMLDYARNHVQTAKEVICWYNYRICWCAVHCVHTTLRFYTRRSTVLLGIMNVRAHSVHFEMSYRTCKNLWSNGGTSNFMDHVYCKDVWRRFLGSHI